jgi:hypothetical protein
MLVKPAALLLSAAVVTIVVTASTAADAGFLCRRGGMGMGGYARTNSYAPNFPTIKQAYKKPSYEQPPARTASPKAAPAAPVKPVKLASTAKPVIVAETPATSSPSIASVASTCLAKDYLDTGAVRFRDTCTKEWAINSAGSDTKTSVSVRTCLTKHTGRDGVVMFKDTCTGEWAMNTARQLVADAQ